MLAFSTAQSVLEQKRGELVIKLIEECYSLIQANEWGKLYEIHRKIIAINSKRVAIYLELAQHCIMIRQYAQALKYCDEAHKIDSSFAPIDFYRGECYKFQSDFKQALNCYNMVILNDEEHAGAFYGRAFCFVRTKDYEAALQDLVDAHKLCKFNPQLSKQISELYAEASRLKNSSEQRYRGLYKGP